MTTIRTPERPGGILAPAYLLTTIGLFGLIAFNAFEAMAVTTVMPGVSRELDGVSLYALVFAAPLAAGVVGMVASGLWSDRSGPVPPLLTSLVVFAAGLMVCGLAPTMEVLVAGRVLQGLGGGALTVGIYVVVGLVYPGRLQPAVFASFAAAWVLPALFGPALAAWVAEVASWRWVFLGVVGLVGVAALLVLRPLRALRRPESRGVTATRSRLLWASIAAVAVLALEMLGSGTGLVLVPAVLAFVVVLAALRPLLPAGTLTGRAGLPALIATRGLLSAGFFALEAYIAFALQEDWGLSPGRAGLALTVVGVVWAVASQAQARLKGRLRNAVAMRVGTLMLLVGSVTLVLAVALHLSALIAVAAFVVAGGGMGFAYPRTGVAMLAATTEQERGSNSSALTIADSLGAALALAMAGIAFTVAERAELDPFAAVFAIAVVFSAAAAACARRTPADDGEQWAP